MRNYENLYKHMSTRDLLVSSRFSKKYKQKKADKSHWCKQRMDEMLSTMVVERCLM